MQLLSRLRGVLDAHFQPGLLPRNSVASQPGTPTTKDPIKERHLALSPRAPQRRHGPCAGALCAAPAAWAVFRCFDYDKEHGTLVWW